MNRTPIFFMMLLNLILASCTKNDRPLNETLDIKVKQNQPVMDEIDQLLLREADITARKRLDQDFSDFLKKIEQERMRGRELKSNSGKKDPLTQDREKFLYIAKECFKGMPLPRPGEGAIFFKLFISPQGVIRDVSITDEEKLKENTQLHRQAVKGREFLLKSPCNFSSLDKRFYEERKEVIISIGGE